MRSHAANGMIMSHSASAPLTDLLQNQLQQQHLELADLRRQSLIDNLIGMGFPIDWALRAAEHSEASVSESSAISW
jgi:hypothetical protein